MIFHKLNRLSEECLPDLSSSLLTDWTLFSSDQMIFFAIDTSNWLLSDSSEMFLIFDVLLTSIIITADFMMTEPDHMIQTLTLIAADNLTVSVKEFNCIMYIV